MTDRETRKQILLAAAIAFAVRRQGQQGSHAGVRSLWSRTAHPHLRRIMWNPRRVAPGWRLDGRLKQQGASPNEI